jgi:hypothetical protein
MVTPKWQGTVIGTSLVQGVETTFADFLSVHDHRWRGANTDPNLFALNCHYRDSNVVTDDNLFADSP